MGLALGVIFDRTRILLGLSVVHIVANSVEVSCGVAPMPGGQARPVPSGAWTEQADEGALVERYMPASYIVE